MSDGRKNNGGARKGAGRKRRDDEIKLIESLDKHIDSERVFNILESKIEEGDMKAIQLYMSYRFGQPKQTIQQNNTHTINDFDINKLYDKKT